MAYSDFEHFNTENNDFEVEPARSNNSLVIRESKTFSPEILKQSKTASPTDARIVLWDYTDDNNFYAARNACYFRWQDPDNYYITLAYVDNDGDVFVEAGKVVGGGYTRIGNFRIDISGSWSNIEDSGVYDFQRFEDDGIAEFWVRWRTTIWQDPNSHTRIRFEEDSDGDGNYSQIAQFEDDDPDFVGGGGVGIGGVDPSIANGRNDTVYYEDTSFFW
jgi:hypothetical protein